MADMYFKLKNVLRKLNPNCRIHRLVKYVTGMEEKLRNFFQNSKWRNGETKMIFKKVEGGYRGHVREIKN